MLNPGVERLLAEASTEFGSEAVVRIASSINLPQIATQPLQRPGFLYLPFIQSGPWQEMADITWSAGWENSYHAIRSECFDLLKQGAFQPYREPNDAPMFWQGGWDIYYLMHSDQLAADVDRKCPVTAMCLKMVPRLAEYAFFSALQPHAQIRPHCGPWNARLTFHFGIEIPAGCGIRVGDEDRVWESGKLLGFDDSFEHSAHNDGERARVVLVFATWHPALTDVEVE